MRNIFIFICCLVFLSGCATKDRGAGEPTLKPVSPLKEAEKSVVPVTERAISAVPVMEKAKIKEPVMPVVRGKSAQPSAVISISAEKRKKVFEFVTIDGEDYAVPHPWRGRKIGERSPQMSSLGQIPLEFSWNRAKLYIREEARDAFVEMAERAKEDNIHLLVHSGFRSMYYQKKIFSKLMARGRTWEDLVRYVAPPGYSEHMLGFAVDLYPSDWQFASTEAYRWLKEHGAEFGFEETYPEFGKEGFPWEAWHWRFTLSSMNNDSLSQAKQ
jgi:hypothetical protein